MIAFSILVRSELPEWPAFNEAESILKEIKGLVHGIERLSDDQRPWTKIADVVQRGYRLFDAEFWNMRGVPAPPSTGSSS